jgi:hypothetical protein
MWLALRFLTLLGVYLWRFLWRRQSYDTERQYRGVPCVRKVVTRKNRFIRAYNGLAFTGPLRFQFTTEKDWDAFFKSLGLAVEQQVGVPEFDRQIYITGDQPALGETLRRDGDARTALLRLFQQGATRVFADGDHLWAETKVEAYDASAMRADLFVLRTALLTIDARDRRNRLDAFFWKAVAVESLAWSVACYGIPGFLELAWNRNTVYPESGALFQTGFLWSLGVLGALLALVFLLLRGSSRGHRIVVESFFLLLVGVPLSTVQAVSDINILADHTPPALVESRVLAKRVEIRRGRRGRTSTHYVLQLQAVTDRPRAVEGRIEVEPALFSAATEGGTVVIVLRAGRLGFPWMESITPR